MTIDWQRFSQLIHSHQRFLLTSHIRPDCDALGSELGMATVLTQLGKDVRIVNAHETPTLFRFLDPATRIETLGKPVQPADLQDREIVMILDTSAWVQLGDMADVIRGLPARRMVLDHHVGEDELGAELFKNTRAEATGRLVVEAADALQIPLTPVSATPLFAALATDTGWYRFGSTTPMTYQVAARLVQAGASPAEIYRQLYEQDTAGRVRLRGVILARTTIELDGRYAHTHVLREDFDRTGALPSDTEDVINMTLAIAGVQFATILVEQPQGNYFKISFRSRCPIDCSQMARQFRGGGHKAAAGGYLEGTVADAQSQIGAAVNGAFATLDAGSIVKS